MKRPIVNDNDIYSIPEACKALGIDRRTLRRYTQAGCIVSHVRRCDGRIVYFGSDIAKCYYDIL